MPTIAIEVTELVMRLREVYEEQGHTQESFADALGVGRQRAANWIKGHNDIDMDRSLQLRLAMMLGVSPIEVLRLHGLAVSEDVPEPGSVSGDSPRPTNPQNGATQPLDIRQARSWSAEVLPLHREDAA